MRQESGDEDELVMLSRLLDQAHAPVVPGQPRVLVGPTWLLGDVIRAVAASAMERYVLAGVAFCERRVTPTADELRAALDTATACTATAIGLARVEADAAEEGRAMSAITRERLAAVVGAIPPGRWMTYRDVAYACGGTDRHARTINQRLLREQLAGAHRVLKADGTISATALGAPEDVQRRLEDEGIEFLDGRATPSARLHLADLTDHHDRE